MTVKNEEANGGDIIIKIQARTSGLRISISELNRINCVNFNDSESRTPERKVGTVVDMSGAVGFTLLSAPEKLYSLVFTTFYNFLIFFAFCFFFYYREITIIQISIYINY